jgi:hypothetical protein
MPVNLIPAIDPAPLPGPPWLFHALWLVTFLVHLVFVNMVMGGSLLAALVGRHRKGGRETQRFFVEANGWAISFAITFGIAPLLFMQVLFGRFFYSATILLAWWWFSMLGILTLAYYLNYIAKHRLQGGRSVRGLLIVEAAGFLVIAAIQVAINVLHLQPGRWESVAQQAGVALMDPTFAPRFLHFVFSAVAMAGLALACVATRKAVAESPEARVDMARFGLRAAFVATALNLADGFWLLLVLPRDVLIPFMRGGAFTMIPLTAGILLGVFLLVALSRITDPLAQAKQVRGIAGLIAATIVFMVVTRHQLRDIYLAPFRVDEQITIATQWGPLVLFLAVFVLCVGLTAYAIVRVVNEKSEPGETLA